MTDARTTLADDIAAAFPSAADDTDALIALLDGCRSHGVRRHALLVDLARLPTALARRPHLALIAAALDPLLGHDRARLFRLADGHLVLIWRGTAEAESERTTQTLDRLFADLPGNEGAAPFGVYSLPADVGTVSAIVTASVAPIEEPAPAGDVRPLDLPTLAALETALAQVDLAPFGRRLPVCTWLAGAAPTLEWEKRTVSLPDLFTAVAGEALNTTAAPWLFRRLTRTLDRRMLAMLSPAELAGAGPFSVALNVATILSPEFQRFDAALPPTLRGQVTLDISPTDLVADATAFAFARDFARARGYRTMLCDVTAGFMSVFPRAAVGVDLIQLRASADLATLGALPHDLPPERVVLGDVRHPSMRDWGHRAGITLFQGPLVRPGRTLRPVSGRLAG